MAYRLARLAEKQIDKLLFESARIWGLEAAGRYGQLLLLAFEVLGDQPERIGSIAVPRQSGVRAYPIRLLREQVGPSRRVGRPRHLVVYRTGTDCVVEILGVVHDRMVLSRAARTLIRRTGEH